MNPEHPGLSGGLLDMAHHGIHEGIFLGGV
jgi:hypothetical protein